MLIQLDSLLPQTFVSSGKGEEATDILLFESTSRNMHRNKLYFHLHQGEGLVFTVPE